MSDARVVPGALSGRELLGLVRKDRAAARERLGALSPDQLADACQELRPAVRGELLLAMETPEAVVPLLPEAELVATVVAGGLGDSAWLLELATPEQRVACLDLDCWRRHDLSLPRLIEWLDALIEAGRPTLLRALEEFDLELWLLALARMADVMVIGKEEEAPPGWFTEDGVCYFYAHSDEDFARVKEIAQAAFSEAQPIYWQLVYGSLFETLSECEEYALRWRTSRLSDLGFPDREQAMQAYRPLRVEEAPTVEVGAGDDAQTLIPFHGLPQQLRTTLVGRALAGLPEGRAADVLGYVLAVANTLAVADGMPLADADSIPVAMGKALRGIDRGLAELSRARRQEPEVVLDHTRPLDLFRIGATLDPEIAPVPPDLDAEEDEEDED